MLGQAIGDVLPMAVGVALSPVPIIAVILMLSTSQARRNAPAFAAGWMVGLVVVSVVVLTVANGADDPSSTAADGTNWLQVGIGVALLALARRQWKRRPIEGSTPEMPTWLATIDTITAGRAFVLGAALSGVNPKNLALSAAAAASLAQLGLDATDTAVAIGVFVVVASLTVAGPVVVFVVATDRAAAALMPVKDFMAVHNAAILCVVFLVFGAKVLGSGLGLVAG